MKLYQILLILFVFGFSVMHSQSPCSNVASQVLCADVAFEADNLEPFPFSLGCFDYPMTNFYSFETGSNQNAYMQIAINYTNCDYIDFG